MFLTATTPTLSSVLGDMSTVMATLLSAATSLLNWVIENPLAYLWILAALIFIVIAIVKSFTRGA